MRNRFACFAVIACAAFLDSSLLAQAPAPTPDENPTGNTGALKEQIQTAGSYSAHSGNATRIANDLHLPGALGVYGLDFTRYWNSLHPDLDNPNAEWPMEFGASGWSHSWRWSAVEGSDIWQTAEGGGPQGTQYWETSITIGFPDGHSTKYKIIRANRSYQGESPGCAGRIGWGPPYLDQCGERNWPPPGWLQDRLCDMAQDGSEFWLHLADGGSVHFTGGPGVYQATEVFDPHGLRTELQYGVDGYLLKVLQDGGRWLDITWEYRENFSVPVITKVQSGGYAGVQTVTYNYNRYPDVVNGAFLVLTSVDYPHDRAPEQPSHAIYTYGFAYSGDDPNVGPQAPYPLLKSANDPRYPGAMTTIRYDYYGGTCPIPNAPPDTPPPDYYWRFYPQPYAIAAEKSGDTAIPVSSFANFCASATRQETNGFGAVRNFYFGGTAGVQGGMGYGCTGYQLAKVTDFYTGSPNNVPFEFQNFLSGEPRQVWDGRNILTDLVLTPGDYSGQPGEIHHTGSGDGSAHYYDRVNAGASEAPDTTRIHNPFNHWLFSQRDERNLTTTYVRDSRRRVKDIIYPVTAEHFTYKVYGNGETYNQLATHTLPSGAVQTYEYDETTHRLIREYNSIDGWDARKEYTYGDPLQPGLYDDLVHTMTDGRARSSGAPYTVMMEYNGRNQVIAVHYPPTPGSSTDPHVSYEYADGYGNCTAITNELGQRSEYTYDSYRRCISYTEPLNAPDWEGGSTVASRTWNWIYDRWIDGIGPRDASAHTKNEWRIQIEPAFNGACDRRMTARAHDVNNRLVIESTGWIQPCNQPIGNWYFGPDGENHYFTYNENGQKNSYTDPLGRVTTYEYDLRNRLWKTNETVNTVPRTTETLYDVTSNKTLVTFPDSRTQQWRDYDSFGQAWTFIDERNNPTNLTYIWGPMKKLYTVTTHRTRDDGTMEDQPTTFSYDLMGKPIDVEFPDHSHETTTYYCKVGLTSYFCDQPHSWTTRKGQQKIMTYDARGREISHTWSDDTPGITRTWDDANRLTVISNSVSTVDFGYDSAGQPLWEGNTIAGSGNYTHINYLRYPNGSVSYMQYPNNLWVHHNYTARGQLKNVLDWNYGYWKPTLTYYYLYDGKVSWQDYVNGVQTSFHYDGRGMIDWLHHHRVSPYQNLAWREYTRDERDRIISWQAGSDNSVNPMQDGRGHRFAYDAEGQLTDAWYGPYDPANSTDGTVREDHFSYDALGNRRASNWQGWDSAINYLRKDTGLNQYRSWQPYSPIINYDDDFGPPWGSPGAANGVVMQDGNITASYNALNQPRAIWTASYGSNYLWYGYDPLGRCVKQWLGPGDGSAPGFIRYSYYDGWNLIEDGSSPWNPEHFYVHGARVDEIVASYTWGEPSYHHYDANGNCMTLTNAAGNITEQYYYDAFGKPYLFDGAGNWLASSPSGNRFLFIGREYLSDLKLYDYRNRLYNPQMGRFLQPDPKEFAAGDYNLYRYCHNDPVNRSDPMGLWPTPIHDQIYETALKNTLSPDELKTIKNESAKQDGIGHQTAAEAYKHAMRSPGQSVDAARRATQNYIANNLKKAIQQQKDGHRESALKALAKGMHAISDSTSPAHEGYQVWNGLPNPLTESPESVAANLASMANHAKQESAISPTKLNETSSLIRDYYQAFESGVAH